MLRCKPGDMAMVTRPYGYGRIVGDAEQFGRVRLPAGAFVTVVAIDIDISPIAWRLAEPLPISCGYVAVTLDDCMLTPYRPWERKGAETKAVRPRKEMA